LRLYLRQPHTSFSLPIDIIATAAPITSNTRDTLHALHTHADMAPKTTKRRKMRPYERKALIIEQLGFGRKQAFRDWRASDLVKPHW